MKSILLRVRAFHAVRPSDPLVDTGLLLLRLLFGFSLALAHGRGTFMAVLRGEFNYPDPIGLGSALSMTLMGFSEFVCALAVAFGILTRLTTIPVLMGFLVAFFFYHSGDPFYERELAYLYGSSFLVILLAGPGKYSIDYYLLRS